MPASGLTLADKLLLFLTYDMLRDSDAAGPLRALPAVATDGLIALACTDDFAGDLGQPEFEPWLNGVGAAILEALQPLLRERWVAMERRKIQIGDWMALA